MTGFDATFLALACGFFVKTDKHRALTALTPLAVFLIQLLPEGMIQQPLIVAAVIVLARSRLAAGAVLALPTYGSVFDAATVTILWWTLSEFMDLLGTGPGRAILAGADATSPPGRSNTHAAKAVPAPGEIQGQDELRNLPRKVMIAGVLHLILYPLSLL